MLIGLAMACAGCIKPPDQREYRLHSGRTIRLLGEGPIHFRKASPALMLRYATDLSIDRDLPAVRAEANEVWTLFRADVERGHFDCGILSVIAQPRSALFGRANGYNFIYVKQADGSWQEVSRKN